MAPTGRAASNMKKMTDRDASTIHRALRYEFDSDCYVIDEVSMVDLTLMCRVMKAIPMGARVIFVGDVDQLPSIGAGNVLADLIRSGVVNVVRLTETFRQARDSVLNKIFQLIRDGKVPQLDTVQLGTDGVSQDVATIDSDAIFLPMNDTDKIQTVFGTLFNNILLAMRLKDDNSINPLTDVQVLVPYKTGENGSIELNKYLQAYLNPPGEKKVQCMWKGVLFRKGDRVIHTVNCSKLDLSNGDVGCVTSIRRTGRFVEEKKRWFDEKKKRWFVEKKKQWVEYYIISVWFGHHSDVTEFSTDPAKPDRTLDLAWALTVHKSQGAEYPVCVFICLDKQQFMLSRRLIYTAMTRAKQKLIVIGQHGALVRGLNKEELVRQTSLCFKIRQAAGLSIE